MNPDRDALEGLVNKNDVGSAEGLPSVSPYLVEYLQANFLGRPFDPMNVAAARSIAEAALWEAGVARGMEVVITHLGLLAQNKGVNANEPTQTESASTDPRRPGTNRRS